MSRANENPPGNSQQDQVPCGSDGLCPILLNLPLERPIKCVPGGSLYPRFCYPELKLKYFIVVPASLLNELGKGRDRIQHFYFYFPFLFLFRNHLLSRNSIVSLETPRRNTQQNPLVFIPEHFTIIKELIVQLLLVLLLATLHRRQQLK